MSDGKMVLRDFDDGYYNLKLKIKQTPSNSEKYKLYLKQLNALEQIKEYIDSYIWVKSEAVKEKLDFIRKSDYDYELVRKEFNLSYNALKCFVYRNSKRLGEKIGRNTVSLILSKEDKVTQGLLTFRICTKTYDLKKILLPECYDTLPKPKLKFFDIKDCKTEIMYLYTYSHIALSFAQEDLDLEKLASLVYILENETEKYREEQRNLISVLQGINIGIEEYMEQLEDENEEKG